MEGNIMENDQIDGTIVPDELDPIEVELPELVDVDTVDDPVDPVADQTAECADELDDDTEGNPA